MVVGYPSVALLASSAVASSRVEVPATLEPALRRACAGAWRTLEVVLSAPAIRQQLAGPGFGHLRDHIEPLLEFALASSADLLARVREIRRSDLFDHYLDMAIVFAACTPDTVRRDLDAAGVVLDDSGVTILLDAVRVVFRHVAIGYPELTPWLPAVTKEATRETALVAFAKLVVSQAAGDLDALLTAPVQIDENVQFTVYRPRAINSIRWHPLLAFAHLSERRPDEDSFDPLDEVRRQAEALLGPQAAHYQPTTVDSGATIPAEGELTFVPQVAGIEFQPQRRTFLWLEPVHREEFRMRGDPSVVGTMVRGRLTVFLGHLVIAEIPLAIRVEAGFTNASRERTNARTYRKIFASYSHRDLAVVSQLEHYARTLGDEYVRDWVNVRTGEVWNSRLMELISQADIFQLFWSTNSMHSKFVRQEYEHALALDRPSFVRPTYWEEPMPTAPGLPPQALLRLQFQKLGIAPTRTRSGGSVCARCGKENQDHYKFCLGCGAELTAKPPAGAGDMARMKTIMADPSRQSPITGAPLRGGAAAGFPAPPSPEMRPPPGVSGFSPGFAPPGPAAGGIMRCPSCGSDVPATFRFCGTCGFRMGDEGAAPNPMPMPPQMGGPITAPQPQRARLSMTLIRPDGTEGGTHDLRPGENMLGRSFGPVFKNDRYLSPMHAVLDLRGMQAVVRDLDSLNGVFVKMTQEEELQSGQIIRIGQELLRFEIIPASKPALDGTEFMCSPNPGYWGKLTVIIGGDVAGAAFPLLGESCTLGRERGEINFPDDGYVSGLHARVTMRDGRVYLADMGSSNGTFMKVHGERAVGHNSFVLLGQQLFRLNLA